MKKEVFLTGFMIELLTSCAGKRQEPLTAEPYQPAPDREAFSGEETTERGLYSVNAAAEEKAAETEMRGIKAAAQETAAQEPETIWIYDIDEGCLMVPYLPQLPHHSYDWSKLKRDGSFLAYEGDNAAEALTGIDVSKFQGEIDWEKVGNTEEISFAIVRLGHRGYESADITLDPFYERNVEGALDAGLLVGAYFFSQAVNVQEAVEEADFVYENVKKYDIEGPIVFDTEKVKFDDYRTEGLSRAELTDCAAAFCERIRGYGYEPMIYANAKWLTTRLELERLTDYRIWYADYEEEPLYPYWFDMWQYSNEGKVDGIDTPVDMNLYFRPEK